MISDKLICLKEKRDKATNALNELLAELKPLMVSTKQEEVLIDNMWTILGIFDAEINMLQNSIDIATYEWEKRFEYSLN